MKTQKLLGIAFALLVSCQGKPVETKFDQHPVSHVRKYPEAIRDMTIYEVNVRQHTPSGTFKALQQDLPRLRTLGVDILWIMPVQEIGRMNRKGTLGSYYSIRDYKSVNAEFGSLDDFKTLVRDAHSQGFLVILDWVPNHTAWDNAWVIEHPEYYMTDSAAAQVGKTLGVDADYYKKKGIGNLVYEADWDDIALLNLYQPEARKAMIDAMRYWITETDIDGFRADHAGHEIPLFFWEEATAELNTIKDLYWLAEWDEPRMHIVFDATYDWRLMGLTTQVAAGKLNADALHDHIAQDVARYGNNAQRLNMINNHDENSWHGTVRERYGEGERAFAVFSFVAYGTPLLYSGQEVGLDKRLKFFEKDTIPMEDAGQYYSFYQKLNELKAENPALWSGRFGSIPEKIEDGNARVFSFRRVKDDNVVVGFINLSPKPQQITIPADVAALKDFFTGKSFAQGKATLVPWEYVVLSPEH